MQGCDQVLEGCAVPEDTRPTGSNVTTWNALDYFKQDFGHDYQHLTVNDAIAACKDVLAWASVVGRLAKDYPHLVAFGIDDFSDNLPPGSPPRPFFTPDVIAAIESRMRAQAPWLSFVPTIYYEYFQNRFSNNWADLVLSLDSIQFFFRNQKHRECIDDTPDCARSAYNAADEIRDMQQLLPSGRKLQLGIYFVGCQDCSKAAAVKDKMTPPMIRYDYDLARLGQNLPIVGGTTAYGLQTPPWMPPEKTGNQFWAPCTGNQCAANCTDFNFLDDTNPPGPPGADPKYNFYEMWGGDRYCALQRVYGSKSHYLTHRDLTPNGPLAVGDPAAFVASDGTNQVIYRSSDGHLHELWWTGPNSAGQGDLIPHGPLAVGDPTAFVASDGTNQVIYRSSDGHLHELWWTGPNPAGQGDLIPHGPLAVGDPTAFVASDGTNQVIYRSSDGHLHELWWTGPNAPGQGDLIPHGPVAAGDPATFIASNGTNNVIYRSADGHVHELWWTGPNPVGQGDLTALTNSPPAQSDSSAYSVTSDGRNHVIYRSSDGHVHELWWILGVITHNDLTELSNAPLAVGDPSAYFSAVDGRHHVIYRGVDSHIHELWWNN